MSPLTLIKNITFTLAATLLISLTQPATTFAQEGDKSKKSIQIERIIEVDKPVTDKPVTDRTLQVRELRINDGDNVLQITGHPDKDAVFISSQVVSRVDLEPTTYLGISAEPLAPGLRAHLDIAKGQGLAVQFVAPGSNAKKAGLAPHDILLQLDDQKLMNMSQLSALIQAREAGETVSLKLIQQGKIKTLKVKLGQRTVPPTEFRIRGGSLPGMGGYLSGGGSVDAGKYEWHQRQGHADESSDFSAKPASEIPYINTERITRELKELQRKIEQHSGTLATELKALAEEASGEAAQQSKIIAERAMKEAKQLMQQVEQQQKMIMKRIQEEQKAHAARANANSSSQSFSQTKTNRSETAVFHDGAHRLSLTINDGKKTLKVTQGDKVIFEGPANNAKQLKKLPAEVLKKFEKLQATIAKKSDEDGSE